MMIFGWMCIGAGIGVLISGIWWWDAGYAAGYREGVNDVNAMICGEVSDVEGC